VGVLIDSNVLIEHERGQLDLGERLRGREDEEFFVSVVTASELLYGVHRALDAGMQARRAAWAEAVLERFPLLPVDLASARVHARIWAELARQGKPIGPNDLWLAAQALAHGLTMVTYHIREFERIPGLIVESWA
jgi:tRNA(fMet)-specific endonuclease VapC